MSRRRNRKEKDDGNGFAEWGGYMEAKKQKLLQQFNSEAQNNVIKESDIFKGIAIFVNGYTNPTSDELKILMALHGGIFHHYQSNSTTHIIASNLPDAKMKLVGKGIPIVKPEWISESISAGKLLDYKSFLLYTNQNRKQPCLPFTVLSKSSIVKNKGNNCILTNVKQDVESPQKGNYSFIDILEEDSPKKKCLNEPIKEFNESTTDIFDESVKNFDLNTEKSGNILQPEAKELDVSFAEPKTSKMSSNKILDTVLSKQKPSSFKITRTAADPLFLSEFYQNSRLHLISTLGAEFKQLVNTKREQWNGKFVGREKLLALPGRFSDVPSHPVIMHIDMDCFFVSVGLRNRPDLRGKPVAVTHAKGSQGVHREESSFAAEIELFKKHWPNEDCGLNKLDSRSSMSEIASCSYEARKFGIKNGMFLGKALKMCPELQTIPYDFQGYREVSSVLYNTIAQYTLDIEAVSCDEMYVDVGPILTEIGLSVDQWASHVRSEIMDTTGCPCSTGFGSNRLQARLATKKAKPAGQFYLKPEDVEEYLANVSLADLPGVGVATVTKLRNLGLFMCADIQKTTLSFLQAELGLKMGEQIFEQAKGIDSKPLNFYHERKSVSADVNYGIRFKTYEESHDFLRRLSDEVFNRLLETGMKAARCLSLKVLVRAPDAPQETAKFLGCGICTSINRSTTKGNLISDAGVAFKEAKHLLDQIKAPPEDFRGIGIQLSRLEKVKPANKLLNDFLKADSNTKKIKNGSKIEEGVAETLECEKHDFPQEILDLPDENRTNLKVKDSSSSNVKEIAIQCSGNSLDEEMNTNRNVEAKQISVQNTKPTRGRPRGRVKNGNGINRSNSSRNLKNYFNDSRPSNFTRQKSDCNNIATKKLEEELSEKLDVDVLKELPEEIQNEILREYKMTMDELEKRRKKATLRLENEKNPLGPTTSDAVNIKESKEVKSSSVSKKQQRSFADLNWEEMKKLLESWIQSESEPLECDVVRLGEYLKELAMNRKIESLQVIVKFLYRNVNEVGKCVWHDAYFKIVDILQQGMVAKYSNTMLVPMNFSCALHK